jgi:hypothetical protein
MNSNNLCKGIAFYGSEVCHLAQVYGRFMFQPILFLEVTKVEMKQHAISGLGI